MRCMACWVRQKPISVWQSVSIQCRIHFLTNILHFLSVQHWTHLFMFCLDVSRMGKVYLNLHISFARIGISFFKPQNSMNSRRIRMIWVFLAHRRTFPSLCWGLNKIEHLISDVAGLPIHQCGSQFHSRNFGNDISWPNRPAVLLLKYETLCRIRKQIMECIHSLFFFKFFTHSRRSVNRSPDRFYNSALKRWESRGTNSLLSRNKPPQMFRFHFGSVRV